MSILENLFKTRRFLRYYSQDKYPEESLINELVEKTFHLVPSKQNLIPYFVNIFGPNRKEEKEQIMELSTRPLHKEKLGRNPNVQLKAPYLLVICNRLVEPNKWVSHLIKTGYMFRVCDKNQYMKIVTAKDVSLEIGMFIAILTGLALEKNISCSYTLCHFNEPEKQTLVKDRVLCIMSLGYPYDEVINEEVHKSRLQKGETRPKLKDLMLWK